MPKKGSQDMEKVIKKANDLLHKYEELDSRVKSASDAATIDAINATEKEVRAQLLQIRQTLDGLRSDVKDSTAIEELRDRIRASIEMWDMENLNEDLGPLDGDDIDNANDDTFGDDTVGVGSLNDMAAMTSKMAGNWETKSPPPSKTASKPVVNEWDRRKQQMQTKQTPPSQPQEAAPPAAAAPAPAQAASQPTAPAKPKESSRPPSSSHSPPPASAPEIDLRTTLEQLDMSLAHLPHTLDVDRQKPYEAPNSIEPIPYYPQEVHPVLSCKEIYSQFDLETLCFIFYYHQKSYQQYFAAKALRDRSYRYHSEDKRWLKRKTQPVESNDKMERGSYTFFNFETWREEELHDFTFEYKYLEGDF